MIVEEKNQVNNKRANYDAEKGLFVGLNFDRWANNNPLISGKF